MNYTLIFFLCALAILIMSIISICVAPIINGFLGEDWGTDNCQLYSDEYNYLKGKYTNPNNQQKQDLDIRKKSINICKRKKAMHGLEYGSLVYDIAIGGICSLLGLLHYLEIGKTIEKKTGLFGIITGIIGFIITMIYIGFSCYIFTNDNKGDIKLFSNGAHFKWNGVKYVYAYDENKMIDNLDIQYATYSELGQKQYNYDSELYKSSLEQTSEYYECKRDLSIIQRESKDADCDYLWENRNFNYSIDNKYIYDRWITTIVFSIFIVVCNIALILFAFFLRNLGDSTQGTTPIPMSSVNALFSKAQ